MATEYDLIQLRGDTTANTNTSAPVLADRELYIEKMNNGIGIKIGDGVSSYALLPYLIYPSPILPNGTANPTSGELGQMFYRTDLTKIVVYNGSGWYNAMGNQVE